VATSFERVRLSGSRAVGRRPPFRGITGKQPGSGGLPLGRARPHAPRWGLRRPRGRKRSPSGGNL